MSSDVKTPLEMFYRWEQETPDKVYLRQPKNLEWSEYTWREVADRVRRIASFLKSKDYPAGSRIGIWSANSMDWPIADLAIMLAGHISVPIYPGQDTQSANYIFNHSEVKIVFCGDFDQWQHVDDALVDGVETVAMLGCKIDADTSLEDIYRDFEPYAESPVPAPEDIFTIIYTSGTTGNPKGVMHMHGTPGHVVPGLVKSFRLEEEPNEFFLLPAHVARRRAHRGGVEQPLCQCQHLFLGGTEDLRRGDPLGTAHPVFRRSAPVGEVQGGDRRQDSA